MYSKCPEGFIISRACDDSKNGRRMDFFPFFVYSVLESVPKVPLLSLAAGNVPFTENLYWDIHVRDVETNALSKLSSY